ncbi:MAG: nucleotidyltransferase domain-containing protein [Bacteroidetes bacterium]|nr:MAG: nucleotidyltransferase domain-containing protein [Bacteroidota bacterium]
MKFGLPEKIIEQINFVFAAFPQVEEAVLYGSRAKGNFKPGSDVDLTLKGSSLNLQVINAISNQLYELPIPYKIDLSIYTQIDNKDLLEHIKRVGVVFYRRGEQEI